MTDLDGKLTYRDYVVHIFTGVIFNVFLLAALFPVLPDKWWEYDLQNEVVWSLIAIPILFLEGHFILAINRLVMVEIFNWYFIIRVKNIRSKQKKDLAQTNKHHHSNVFYRTVAKDLRQRWYDNLFNKKCKILFFLLISVRISGQKVVRKKKIGILAEKEKTESSTRYYSLSDFFKGVTCSAFIASIVAAFIRNWWVVVAMLIILFLSRQRLRFYSMLYVKSHYKKKDTKKEQETGEKANSTNQQCPA